jgi:hypothetical protein
LQLGGALPSLRCVLVQLGDDLLAFAQDGAHFLADPRALLQPSAALNRFEQLAAQLRGLALHLGGLHAGALRVLPRGDELRFEPGDALFVGRGA